MISPCELDVTCAGNRTREEPRVLDVTDLILDGVDDEGRDVDRRYDVAYVDLERHPRERLPGRWGRGIPLNPSEKIATPLDVAHARHEILEAEALPPGLGETCAVLL